MPYVLEQNNGGNKTVSVIEKNRWTEYGAFKLNETVMHHHPENASVSHGRMITGVNVVTKFRLLGFYWITITKLARFVVGFASPVIAGLVARIVFSG